MSCAIRRDRRIPSPRVADTPDWRDISLLFDASPNACTFAEPVSAFEVDAERDALSRYHASELARVLPIWRRAGRRLRIAGLVLLAAAICLALCAFEVYR